MFRQPPALLTSLRFRLSLHCVRMLLFVSALLAQQPMLPACKSVDRCGTGAHLPALTLPLLGCSCCISAPALLHCNLTYLLFQTCPFPLVLGKFSSCSRSCAAAGWEHPSRARCIPTPVFAFSWSLQRAGIQFCCCFFLNTILSLLGVPRRASRQQLCELGASQQHKGGNRSRKALTRLCSAQGQHPVLQASSPACMGVCPAREHTAGCRSSCSRDLGAGGSFASIRAVQLAIEQPKASGSCSSPRENFSFVGSVEGKMKGRILGCVRS